MYPGVEAVENTKFAFKNISMVSVRDSQNASYMNFCQSFIDSHVYTNETIYVLFYKAAAKTLAFQLKSFKGVIDVLDDPVAIKHYSELLHDLEFISDSFESATTNSNQIYCNLDALSYDGSNLKNKALTYHLLTNMLNLLSEMYRDLYNESDGIFSYDPDMYTVDEMFVHSMYMVWRTFFTMPLNLDYLLRVTFGCSKANQFQLFDTEHGFRIIGEWLEHKLTFAQKIDALLYRYIYEEVDTSKLIKDLVGLGYDKYNSYSFETEEDVENVFDEIFEYTGGLLSRDVGQEDGRYDPWV